MAGSACSAPLILVCTSVGLFRSTCRFCTVPKVDFAPSQRWLSPMFPASWMTHSSLVRPAALSLALADVGQRAERRGPVLARVDRDDRDPGADRGLDRVLQGVRVGHRDDQP